MELTANVQQLLGTIHSNPTASLLANRRIPTPLVQDIRKYVSSNAKQFEMRGLDELLGGHNLPWTVENFYLAIQSIGIEDAEMIFRFLLQFIQVEYGAASMETHLLSGEPRLFALCRSVIEEGVAQNYVLEYAINNHLCYQSGKQWLLTRLGQVLLRLSELQATHFLLKLEMFLNAGKWDEWHMSRKFLEDIHKAGWSLSQFPPGDEDRIGKPRMWEEYLDRLRLFDLVTDSPEEENSGHITVLTKLGKIITESVVARENVYDALIPLFINEELIGITPEGLSVSQISRLRGILQDSPLTGDLRQSILDEIDRLVKGEDPFSVFKALVPCVEGVLKRIVVIEKLEAGKEVTGIGDYIELIKKSPQEILKSGTLQMIDKVIRPNRNISQHGEVIAPELARILCEVTLGIIDRIHKEYQDYQESQR